MTDSGVPAPPEAVSGQTRVLLSDALNRVLDKGAMVAGSITIAVADIDLIQLDLTVLLSAIETAVQHRLDAAMTPQNTLTDASEGGSRDR